MTTHADKIRAGLAAARAKGTRIGRPKVDIDVSAAVALLRGGMGLRSVAFQMKVDRNALRRRLEEVGAWGDGAVVSQ